MDAAQLNGFTAQHRQLIRAVHEIVDGGAGQLFVEEQLRGLESLQIIRPEDPGIVWKGPCPTGELRETPQGVHVQGDKYSGGASWGAVDFGNPPQVERPGQIR